MQPHDEQAIRDFLGERPDASQLRDWRITLQQRLDALRKEQTVTGNERLKPKIDQLRKQVDALLQEEAITSFVEDSVRVTMAMGASSDASEEYE